MKYCMLLCLAWCGTIITLSDASEQCPSSNEASIGISLDIERNLTGHWIVSVTSQNIQDSGNRTKFKIGLDHTIRSCNNTDIILLKSNEIIEPPSDSNHNQSKKLQYIPRTEWLAQPIVALLDPLYHPVPYVIISHSATEQCELRAACTLQVRMLQTFHIESKGWWDIAYNFLVGGDGYAYVGRGWDAVGSHSYGYNNRSIGINFIGTFDTELPPENQIRAAELIIEDGVKLGKIAEDYKILAHRQVSAMESPGQRLYEELQTWPHWSATP